MLLLFFTSYGQVAITNLNIAYEQNFNRLSATGITNDVSTLPLGWTFIETGTNANTTYAAGNGTSNAGNTYSLGTDTTDRALGGLLSGSLNPTIGAAFVNNTASTITSLTISYSGEQWRLGAINRGADRLDFQYSTNAINLSTGTWTDVDALDFSSPITSGTAGPLDGNADANRSAISFRVTGLEITPGSSFFIRWLDFNVASSDDALAVDDFSIIATGTTGNQPAITFSPATLNFGNVNANESDTLRYEVTTTNINNYPVIIFSQDPSFSISTDNVFFSDSTGLPAEGGVVYVRFTPVENRNYNGTISHYSDGINANFTVSGTGFDQVSSIIPISSASTRSIGTEVTVAGRVTVADELGNPAYIQDATGGIPVFYAPLASGVSIGDSVIVTGPIGSFNDQVQISGNGIRYTRINTPSRGITPKPIMLHDLAANEGLLVTIQNVSLVNNKFVFYPQSTERITDGTTEADLRIDGDTGIPGFQKPQETVDITGVVGRFRANAQLQPRFIEDIPGATEPGTEYDSIPKATTFDVVNWNFEFFGARREDYNEEYGPEDEALQLQNIRTVLSSLNADIIAVQEISDEAYFGELVSQLSGYSYTCSQRYSYSFEGPSNTFPPQKVCFIYDTTTINILSTRVMFENLYDSVRTINPTLLPGYPGGSPSSFYSSGRLPFLLTADVRIGNVTERVSFINIHAKSGSAPEDRNRRAYDAQVLKDTLDTQFAGEQFIILGDLNDDLDQSITAGQPSPYASFVADTSNYNALTKVLSEAGARSTVSFNDVIDHQIASDDLHEEYLQGSAQIIVPFRQVENYAATTSDHLPVLTRYKLHQPIVVFVQNSITLSEDSSAYTVQLQFNKPVTQTTQIAIHIEGNALYGSDFTTTPATQNNSLTLTVNQGAAEAHFTISILDDKLDELAESIKFIIQPHPGIEIAANSTLTVTVEDNDIPSIAFNERYASAKEGSDAYYVKLNLSTPAASEQTAIINIYGAPWISSGADYEVEGASTNKVEVNIPAGSAEAGFMIQAKADNKRELPIELLTFNLAEVSDGLRIATPKYSLFGIIDVKKKRNFYAYPNPTNGIFKLLCEECEEDITIRAVLTNERGSIIYQGTGSIEKLNQRLSLSLLSSKRGTYILKAVVDDETYTVRIIRN